MLREDFVHHKIHPLRSLTKETLREIVRLYHYRSKTLTKIVVKETKLTT